MGGDRVPGPLDDAVDEETRQRKESHERHRGEIRHGEGIQGTILRAQASHAAEFNRLDEIAVDVYHSTHSSFLRAFADAWCKADQWNKMILRPAWVKVIEKYNLHKEAEP